jgi:hypothetical protein
MDACARVRSPSIASLHSVDPKGEDSWRTLLYNRFFPDEETFLKFDFVASLLSDVDEHFEEVEFKKEIEGSRGAIADSVFSYMQRIIDRFAALASCQPSDLLRTPCVFTCPSRFGMGERVPILLGSYHSAYYLPRNVDVDLLSHDDEMSQQAREILKKCSTLLGADVSLYDVDCIKGKHWQSSQ